MIISFKRIETKPLDGWAARDLMDKGRFLSVSDAQASHRLAQVAEQTPTPALGKIKSEQEALSRRQSELDSRRDEQLKLVAQWDSKVAALESAHRRLNHGLQQFENLQGDVDGRLGYIDGSVWGCEYGPHSQPSGIVQLYSYLVASERLQSDFPRWRAARENEIAALEADLTAFAALHKITPGK